MPEKRAIDPAMAAAPIPDLPTIHGFDQAASPYSLRYIVQRVDAGSTRFDLRLELDGFLRSWEIGEPPSYYPGDHRTAERVADLPADAHLLHGRYGDGFVSFWDWGSWKPEGDAAAGIAQGRLAFDIRGGRMQGHWILERLSEKQWSLSKLDDQYALPAREAAALAARQLAEPVEKTGGEQFFTGDGTPRYQGAIPGMPNPGGRARRKKQAEDPEEEIGLTEEQRLLLRKKAQMQRMRMMSPAEVKAMRKAGPSALKAIGLAGAAALGGAAAGMVKPAADKVAAAGPLRSIIRDGKVVILNDEGFDVTYLHPATARDQEYDLMGRGLIKAPYLPREPSGGLTAEAGGETESFDGLGRRKPGLDNQINNRREGEGGLLSEEPADKRNDDNLGDAAVVALAAAAITGASYITTNSKIEADPSMGGDSDIDADSVIGDGSVITTASFIDDGETGAIAASVVGPGGIITANSDIAGVSEITSLSFIDADGKIGDSAAITTAYEEGISPAIITDGARITSGSRVGGNSRIGDAPLIPEAAVIGAAAVIGDVAPETAVTVFAADALDIGPGPIEDDVAIGFEPAPGSPAAGEFDGGEAFESHPAEAPPIPDIPEPEPIVFDGDQDDGSGDNTDAGETDNGGDTDTGGGIEGMEGRDIDMDFNGAVMESAAFLPIAGASPEILMALGVSPDRLAGYYQEAAPLIAKITGGAALMNEGHVEQLMANDRISFAIQGQSEAEVKQAALALRQSLDDQGLQALPIVNGQGGVEVVVPGAPVSPEARHALAADIAARVAALNVAIDLTANQNPDAPVPFTVHEQEGAPVEMMLRWDDLGLVALDRPLGLEAARDYLQKYGEGLSDAYVAARELNQPIIADYGASGPSPVPE